MALSDLSPARQRLVRAAVRHAEITLAGFLPPRVSRPGESRPILPDSFSLNRLAENLEDMLAFCNGPNYEMFLRSNEEQITGALGNAVVDAVRNTVRLAEKATGARFAVLNR